MKPTIGEVPEGTKKKLTRQSVMKIDPNWLILLDESLELLASQLKGHGKVVDDPRDLPILRIASTGAHVGKEHNI